MEGRWGPLEPGLQYRAFERHGALPLFFISLFRDRSGPGPFQSSLRAGVLECQWDSARSLAIPSVDCGSQARVGGGLAGCSLAAASFEASAFVDAPPTRLVPALSSLTGSLSPE